MYSYIITTKVFTSFMAFQEKEHQPYLQLWSLLNQVAIPMHTGLIAILYQNVGNTHNSTTLQPHHCRVSQAISGIAFLPRRVGAGGGSIIPNIAHFLKTVSDD